MGKISNVINHYLSDNRRFADLFNGVYFQGEPVIRADDLLEGSQVYYGITGVAGKSRTAHQTEGRETYLERRNRTRDICKQLKNGETLRILAVENQERVDYTMPYRCMEYDVMEYGKQLDILRKKTNRNIRKT